MGRRAGDELRRRAPLSRGPAAGTVPEGVDLRRGCRGFGGGGGEWGDDLMRRVLQNRGPETVTGGARRGAQECPPEMEGGEMGQPTWRIVNLGEAPGVRLVGFFGNWSPQRGAGEPPVPVVT